MRHKFLSSILFSALAFSAMASENLTYPVAPSDTVVDNYFGIQLADIFRPLEDDNAPATLRWVQQENALTDTWMAQTPFRAQLRNRLTQLYNFGRMGTPWRGNDGMYYVFDNNGLQNQSVLYRMKKPGSRRSVFLDPNTLSSDGTVALKSLTQSDNGKLTAYSVSRGGSDWEEIFVMDTKSRRLLPDHIEWVKFSAPVWNGNDGFFYSAYPRPEAGGELSAANEGHSVYYHKIGTSQADDVLVYGDPEHPLHFHTAYVPEGEPLLFILTGGAGNGNAISVKRLDVPNAQWTVIEETQDNNHDIIDVIGNQIFIASFENAPMGRIVVADADNPVKENWKEIIPQQNGVVSSATIVGDKLLVTYEIDASDHVKIFDLQGTPLGELQLPGFGSVALSGSKKVPDELFYSFTSFATPGTIYSHDLKTNRSTLFHAPEINGLNLDDFTVEQVFYTSKDGTRVPMFIVYKKGLQRDGSNPVYLYGYGGFNISLTPSYSAPRMLWLENGGIYAVANLRGGSEYGEQWHEAGTKLQKQNVFDDFIAAAEYLVDEGWTSPENLVIEGGSNGGLLVGAVVNQRPELFRVAIPRVGVMDMMRYHLFTIGWNWAHDYGRSDDSPEMAKYLLGYSPLHNIRNDATPYPAILVTTADHDDRVVPAHSFKYAAALQAADTGDAPKLIRIDANAGHGGGKPVAKLIDEWTDIYSFIFRNLNRPYPAN